MSRQEGIRKLEHALITGAAGFIGSTLAEALLASGIGVRGVDRLSDYYDPELKRENLAPLLKQEAFELVEADVTEANPGELLDGVDTIFHLAGQPGVRASWGTQFEVYVKDNMLSTQRLLEAAREHEVGRFVLASSSSIYGDAERFPTHEDDKPGPLSPYGVTKLAAEHLCRLYHSGYGVPTVALRYFTIFGPKQRPDMAFNRFIRAALEGSSIDVFGDGLQERDFTFVDDAVSATVAAAQMGTPGRVYNVAGGNSATVLEVIQTLRQLTGSEITIESKPAVVGDARRTGADTARAREELLYVPSVSLAEGLARQLEYERRRAN